MTARYDGGDLTEETRQRLRPFYDAWLTGCRPWEGAAMESFARTWSEEKGLSLKEIAMPLRWALTGRKVSPGVFEVAQLLGPEECGRRLAHYGLASPR